MPCTKKVKRQRSRSTDPDPAPKRHRPNRATPILRLSDELFLRIASHLPTRDLAALQLVSHRCSRIAVDGQIWKALYYRRYVRPRASRIPGLLRTQLGDYSSRRSIWLEEEGIAREVGTNWKALYRLKHNWVRGACGVREIDGAWGVVDGEEELQMESGLLVRLFEGIVFTASPSLGLRAWRLHSTDELIASTSLYSNAAPFSGVGAPTALAVDEASGGTAGRVNVAVGFSKGAFATYQLDMLQEAPIFRTSHVRPPGNRTSREAPNTMVTAMAYLGPYLSTMAGQTWEIYDFSDSLEGAASGADERGAIDVPDTTGSGEGEPKAAHVVVSVDDDDLSGRSSSSSSAAAAATSSAASSSISRNLPSSSGTTKSNRMIHSITPQLHAPPPKLLASLQSSTAWPPSTLSLRRSVNGTLLASVVYASPLYTAGWSVGMQELRFSTSPTTILEESRIATSVPSAFTPVGAASGTPGNSGNSGSSPGGVGTGPARMLSSHGGSQHYDPPLAQPTSVSYSHPYLVTSHADNTLTLHLVRSTSSALIIDAGQRLYGHTAAVSDVLVDSRGKAVSVDRAGREMRVWELEGGVSERRRDAASVRVEPVHDVVFHHRADADDTARGRLGGFDEEKVVVFKEDARLLVYDFSR